MWHRIQSVEKILQILAHLPTADPPPDLARKTLSRLQDARPATAKAAKQRSAAANSARPTA